jgi:hypothetical protein
MNSGWHEVYAVVVRYLTTNGEFREQWVSPTEDLANSELDEL